VRALNTFQGGGEGDGAVDGKEGRAEGGAGGVGRKCLSMWVVPQ